MVGKNGIRDRDYRSSCVLVVMLQHNLNLMLQMCLFMNSAERILDTSCGGEIDLLHFIAQIVQNYHGCDPNEHVYESYKINVLNMKNC